MMEKRFRLIWLSVFVIITGCHMFEDSENVDECPLNSGFPCPCSMEMSGGFCEDQSHCVTDGDDYGICKMPCGSTASCEETQGWGIAGLCDQDLDEDGKYCQVICDHSDGDAGYCPPGMDCVWVDDTQYAICETRF